MTSRTGQMYVHASVHPHGVNIFKTIRLGDRLADVNEAWHVYSMGWGTKLPGSEILNFGPKILN